ncbi:MAG: TraR/DksA C4-type zinc finger protein, partial [Acidobacteriota bacterium]
LHEGAYGDCIECLAPIDELRLRALPFAVRCTACEDALEATERRDRFTTSGHSSSLLFLDRTS